MNEDINYGIPQPKPKKGGQLEQIMKLANRDGICETCGNLLRIHEGSFGCVIRDKLIMPELPPHTRTDNPCKDWKERK